MPVMKITVDAAMRARDVSRPNADQETSAREADADLAGTALDTARGRAEGTSQDNAAQAGPSAGGHRPADHATRPRSRRAAAAAGRSQPEAATSAPAGSSAPADRADQAGAAAGEAPARAGATGEVRAAGETGAAAKPARSRRRRRRR